MGELLQVSILCWQRSLFEPGPGDERLEQVKKKREAGILSIVSIIGFRGTKQIKKDWRGIVDHQNIKKDWRGIVDHQKQIKSGYN